MQRYFCNNLNNNTFTLDNDDSYHIIKVMRNKTDDEIEVIYNNKLFLCTINNLNKNVCCTIIKELDASSSDINITIAQSLVVEKKLDFILQKCTELGVNKFIPIKTVRSIIKIKEKDLQNKKDRWQKIVLGASKQSKRIIVPDISNIISLQNIHVDDYDYIFFCSVNEKSKTLKKGLQNINRCAKLLLVIGPEGGFTPLEEQEMINKNFIPVSLGNLVLRTETAAIVAISMINYHFMR